MLSSSTESRLADLSGLATAKKIVRRIASSETGVHAVLLYGARGCGKTELANALAEAWLCTAPTSEGADGACRACTSFGRGANPDVCHIVPAQPSNIIRRKAITHTDNMEPTDQAPLREFFRTAPIASRSKVVIIQDADRMNGDAANALLKTLEEPHPYAKLVLTTSSVGNMLPTILSRCLAVCCELPSANEVASLSPDLTADDLRLAEGAPGRVRTILRHADRYHRIIDFARSLSTRPIGEALKASEEFRSIADGIEKATGCGARNANAEALSMLAAFLAREQGVSPRWPQYVIESHRRIQGNGSPQLVLDALFIKILQRRPPNVLRF